MIATLTEMNGFKCAIKTIDNALKHEVKDTDSLLSLHRRIHGNYVELPPIQLSDNIPELSCVISDLKAYDLKLKKTGGRT